MSKFGAPGQSASYPHTSTPMSNYMSIRRPKQEVTQSGVNPHSAAQLRQRNQQQQQQPIIYNDQYDMRPITSCSYNWNQGSLFY